MLVVDDVEDVMFDGRDYQWTMLRFTGGDGFDWIIGDRFWGFFFGIGS